MSKFKFIRVDSPLKASTLWTRVDAAIAAIRAEGLNADLVWTFEVSRSICAMGATTIYYGVSPVLFALIIGRVPDVKAWRLGSDKRCTGRH